MTFPKHSIDAAAIPRQVLTLLVVYRWLSVIPVLLALLASPRPYLLPLLLTAAANLLITLKADTLNRAVYRRPWLLLLDLAFLTGLILATGGWRSPFTLYVLNPLLIAAFLFGLRGALTTAVTFTPLYLAAVAWVAAQSGDNPNWLLVLTAVVGFGLIAGTFGYASTLVMQLRLAQRDLRASHTNLALLHRLTVALQNAADVEAMQEEVLTIATTDVGGRRAVMGLVDVDTAVLTSWLGRVRDGQILDTSTLAHPAQIPLSAAGGLVAQALLDQQICHAGAGPCTSDIWLNSHFGMANCHIFPLVQGDQPIGVLLVNFDDEAAAVANRPLLEAIAAQTAAAMAAMLGRLSRARQLAVQEERIRIAQDIHDSVSQSLFGIVFTLDGSLKLLPDHAAEVVPELERALRSAEEVRAEIRHAILDLWPTQLTATRFTADLQKYAAEACRVNDTELTFDIRGDFAALSPLARRSLYRMSQEALNNIGAHAQASEARVCVDVAGGRAQLVVRDNGRGFDTAVAFSRRFDHDHFGLEGIQKRAESLGGECHIFSQPGAGTSVVVDIPVSS